MNPFDLYPGAIVSLESREGRRQVWLHVGNQRHPLVNWPDLEQGMMNKAPNGDFSNSSPLEGKGTGVFKN
jgi:hypothetical protein